MITTAPSNRGACRQPGVLIRYEGTSDWDVFLERWLQMQLADARGWSEAICRFKSRRNRVVVYATLLRGDVVS